MRVQSAGPGVVHDSQWLLQQNPKAYTVQLVMSPSQADMARFIDRNMEQLALNSLAFSVTEHDQREHYNLFFGVFNTVAQARAAIAALPAELRANRPWVRQFQSVQDSLRCVLLKFNPPSQDVAYRRCRRRLS
jgi:septal ring-binding cell division protein DamX